jgi:hypothetical protein
MMELDEGKGRVWKIIIGVVVVVAIVLTVIYWTPISKFAGEAIASISQTATPTPMVSEEPTVEPTLQVTAEPVLTSTGMTVTKMYEQNGWPILTSFSVTSCSADTKSMSVFFNGNVIDLVDDDPGSVAYIGSYPSVNDFETVSMFSKEFCDANIGIDFTAMQNAEMDTKQISLVLIAVDKMPSLTTDLTTWDKTTATLVAWKYPSYPMVVENITTGESALLPYVTTFDDQGNFSLLMPGNRMWGVVNVEPDATFGFSTNLTQSMPDMDKLKQAVALAKQYYPDSVSPILGATTACYLLNTDYGGGALEQVAVLDLCQMYYTKK